MYKNFLDKEIYVTKLNRIIFVDKNEYPEKKTDFGTMLCGNEIIFHFSGHATVFFDDNVFETKENTIRFLPEGNTKRYIVDRIERGNCILISFCTLKPISNEAFVLDASKNKKLPQLFKKAFSVWIKKEPGFYFECISILYKILSELQRNTYALPKKYTLIKPAIDYINENCCTKVISTNDITSLCGISYSYFRQLFVDFMGITPKKYIISLKINKSCELLSGNKLSMSEIAEKCGFGESYYFSRLFKEYMGMSPKEYQKKYKSSK